MIEQEEQSKKIKVLTLGDHPLLPSGVGTQCNYIFRALLDTGRYEIFSLGGAMNIPEEHLNNLQIVDEYEGAWKILPVNGYGTQDLIRSIMFTEKPDIMWLMTDPRYYEWLWMIEPEIRANMPIVYYNIWDNLPYPLFNRKFYESNDHLACISKVTYDIVKHVAPDTDSCYLPHSVDTDIFKKREPEEVESFRQMATKANNGAFSGKFLFFWNNRNARRKQAGSLIYWFNEFLNIVGRDKASLLLHTDPHDVHGQNLEAILEDFDLTDGQVFISRGKMSAQDLSFLYNLADCTINISDAEGFGLATLESLACETPIIVNMTGGLQEQVTDGQEWFGIGVDPASRSLIGSQEVPYIYEDRLNKDDFVNALLDMFNATEEERAEWGRKGRNHVETNYNFNDYQTRWITLMDEVHEKFGSWENRKNYTPYQVINL